MEIVLSLMVVLLLTIVGYIYLIYMHIKESKGNLKEIKSYIPTSLKKIMLLIMPLMIGTALIIMLHIYYPNAAVLHNMKLLSLVMIIFPIAVSDYRKHIVPNKILVFALALRLIIYIFEFIKSISEAFETLKGDVIGAAIVGAFFLLCILIIKNSVGMGDIKLFVVMGLYQGMWGCINSIFWALVVSFVVSIVLLISKKKTRKDAIPFGPSVLIGTVIAIAISGI